MQPKTAFRKSAKGQAEVQSQNRGINPERRETLTMQEGELKRQLSPQSDILIQMETSLIPGKIYYLYRKQDCSWTIQ